MTGLNPTLFGVYIYIEVFWQEQELRNNVSWMKLRNYFIYPTFFRINIIPLHISCHSKICNLARLSFTNKNIPRRQITMNDL